MLPDGLIYINSWLEKNGDRCFQLMETDDVALLQEWILNWRSVMSFEIVPVITSKQTRELVLPRLATLVSET